MKIYDYDASTGEYLGVSTARESPLEAGTYLLPAHTTTTAPPDAETGYARVWSGTAWTQVEDHRGATVYSTSTGAAQVITALGALPDGVTTTAPMATQSWDATTKAWTADSAKVTAAANAAIDAQIAALEALQTPRLMREAALGLTTAIGGSGTLAGKTPGEALTYLNTQITALRATRTSTTSGTSTSTASTSSSTASTSTTSTSTTASA